jgi:DNA-binding NarL/FixJ family response regulator
MRKFVRHEDRPVTRREKEILRLLAGGLTNGDIAHSLFVTRRTIESHLSSLFKKARVGNRTMLLLWAAKEGHVQLSDDMANLVYFPLQRAAA